MPTTPYAKVVASINGGSLVSGGLLVNPGDVVQLSGENTTGWGGAPAPLWQIFDYPEGYTLPSGWTSDASADYPTYFFSGVTPPPFTMPTISMWGKFAPRLTVNGNLVDEQTSFSMLSAGGLADIGFNEDKQFGGRRSWTRDVKRNLRVIDGVAAPGIIRIATATPSTLSPGMTAYVDNGGDGAPAALMPPSPPDGALCRVVDTTHRFGAAPYTVNANSGQTIEDPGSPGTYGASCVLSVASCAVQWMYNLALTQWKVV